ncbi:hypothetical protein MMC26_000097 [Xylographa opegraphella]|nr:hypothetical protein [Xylographa opegraphella]
MFYFGPETAQDPVTPNGNLDEDEAACTSSTFSHRPRSTKVARKEPPENGYSYEFEGRAVKRSRRSNGSTATTNGAVPKSGDSMDVDQSGHPPSQHAEATIKHDFPSAKSPSTAAAAAEAAGPTDATAGGMSMDVDAAATALGADEGALQVQPTTTTPTPTPTLTNGRSVGVQSDKVAELGPGTTVLRVPEKKNVTHAAWNPRDPRILATGGTALCRLWTLAYVPAAPTSPSVDAPDGSPKQYTPTDLLDGSENCFVTSMAWSPDGEYLAVAHYASSPVSRGMIVTCTKDGAMLDELPGGTDMVLNLAWNASGSLILGVTHSDDVDSTLVVWDVQTGSSMQPFHLPTAVLDAAWTEDRKFVVCGNGLIAESHIEDHSIDALRSTRLGVDSSCEWSKIRYDDVTHSMAIAAETSGDLAIVDSSGTMRVKRAHDAEITGLVYQPLSNPATFPDSVPRLLATASIDGSIKIWDARRPFDLVQSFGLGSASPALAMSFTPDGYLVAAASWDKVLFWKAEGRGMPTATWRGKDGEWQTGLDHHMDGVDDDDDDEMRMDTHSLSWDAHGKKLAYGLRDQVCIGTRHSPIYFS